MGEGTSEAAKRYGQRGVSAAKEEVHAALGDSDKGLYPRAFCKVVADDLTGDPDYCVAMHADGAGTKSALAYLYWRETGDLSVFRGIAQDSLVMNLDDLLCIGATGPFLLSNTIGRNKKRVPGEVIAQIIQGYEALTAQFAQWGVRVVNTGGETADVGDLVRTLIVDSTLTARLRRDEVIANDRVKAGDLIIGLASFGQASYEARYNAGMGSNGLTSARHDLLAHEYAAKYPETHDPELPPELCYVGPHRLTDPLPGGPLPGAPAPSEQGGVDVGRAILSPTRSYAPVLIPLLKQHRASITALVHATGGGQTKTLRAGHGIHYVKDNPFPPPPLFAEIQRVSGSPWREMYQVFNMGHRMEIIGQAALWPVVRDLAASLNIEARLIGRCEASASGKNRVSITTPTGVEVYEA